MTTRVTSTNRPQLLRHGIVLEYLTVGWNVVEGIIAIGAGMAAGSVALIGFGIDSFVESGSGSVLLWRLRAEASGRADDEQVQRVERRAERLVGVSFLALAAYVAYQAVSTLVLRDEPAASPVGIALTLVSLVVMLRLARAKHRTGVALGSRALIADSQQTFACWYLSATTLVGLALNSVFGLWWADPVAALVIVVILGREGIEALRGEDHDD